MSEWKVEVRVAMVSNVLKESCSIEPTPFQ